LTEVDARAEDEDWAREVAPEPPAAARKERDATPRPPPAVLAGVGTIALEPERVRRLVEAATFAPSSGNAQPWRFYYENRVLVLARDARRGGDFLDVEGTATQVALGAAVESLVLEAHAEGLAALVNLVERADAPDVVATFQFAPKDTGAPDEPAAFDALRDFVRLRGTERRARERHAIGRGTLDAIADAGASAGTHVALLTSDVDLALLGALLGAVGRVRLSSPIAQRDGRAWGGGAGLEDRARRAVRSASAAILVSTPTHAPRGWTAGGRAVQRAWLTATMLGLAVQPMTVLPFLLARASRIGGEGLDDEDRATLAAAQTKFDALFPDARGETVLMLALLRPRGPVSARALGRPVEEVLTFRA
jgi:nitroreductase